MIFIPLDLYNNKKDVYETEEMNILQITRLAPVIPSDIDKGTYIRCDDGKRYMTNEPIDKIMLKINAKKDDLVANLIAHLMLPKKIVRKRK